MVGVCAYEIIVKIILFYYCKLLLCIYRHNKIDKYKETFLLDYTKSQIIFVCLLIKSNSSKGTLIYVSYISVSVIIIYSCLTLVF